MRHHLAADLTEAAQAVGDREEAVRVHRRDVAGRVPTVSQHLGGFLRLPQVALHHVRPLDEQQPRPTKRNRRLGIGIDNARDHTRQWMPDATTLGSDLPKAGRAEVTCVDRHHRRGFSRAIALHRPKAKSILERSGQALRQFLRTGQYKLHATELLRRASAHVDLQERRCGQQERRPILTHQFADASAVDWVRVIYRTRTEQRR